ncbi:MAG: hypothetical protein ACOCYE_08870 [Pseudomonadota bacterium]
MRRFTTLSSVAIEHGFYADGRPTGLRFVPDPATARRLAAPDLVLRTEPAGLLVAGEVDAWAADGPVVLRFLVHDADGSFARAAEPFLGAGDGLLRLASQRAVDAGEGRFRLHKAPFVRRADLRKPDAEARPSPLLPGRRPLFELVLEVAPETVGRTYVARFQPRRVFWTYYVQGGDPEAALRVVDADGAEDFVDLGPLGERTRLRGRGFRSRRALAVAERPGRRFQLREAVATGERVLIRNLPVAGLAYRRVPGRKDAALEAEIYVNL